MRRRPKREFYFRLAGHLGMTVASLLVKLGLDSKKSDKDVKRAARGLDNLINRFDHVGDIGKLTAITTAVGALTSLTAAAGPAAGTVLALPAAALMAGAGVAVLATGLSGMGDALAATGGQVSQMRRDLMALGYELPQWGADSDYGQEAANAVVAFQSDHGYGVVDGIAGPETLAGIALALRLQANATDYPAPRGPAAPAHRSPWTTRPVTCSRSSPSTTTRR